jgi:hypothetical protein
MSQAAPAKINPAHVVEFDLVRRTEALVTIADWASELREMIAAGFDRHADIDWLKVEVERFKLGCRGARP